MKFRATFARWFIRIAVLVVLALVAVQLWYAGWIAWWRWNDPDETAFMRRELAALQARNPRAELKHRWVPYERIATSLKRAVITAEDARFAEHEGVDWEAIEKAYKDNVKRGRPARGRIDDHAAVGEEVSSCRQSAAMCARRRNSAVSVHH